MDDLVQRYPENLVVGQLRRLYKREIERVVEEIGDLLPGYRARVDETTYELERAKVMLVKAYGREGTLGVRGLEASLKYLLKTQRALNEAASPDGGAQRAARTG
jgi:hypothetical protein